LDPNRVLVIAFADNSGREEAEALGSWAQEYIIQVLTEAGFAKVVDHLTALAVSQNVAADGMAGGPGDVLALADDARAGTVVSGSYYAERDSVYIQTHITDANGGSSLGTVPPVAGSIGERRELVARLAQEVVVTLAPLLDRELGAWEPTVQPATFEAYEAYSEGLEAYMVEGEAKAAPHFERAVAADPTFSRARLWAAQSYMLIGWYTSEWSGVAKAESLIAPLVESPGQLSRYERCRLEFVKALRPPSHVPAMYEATRCMVDAAPGSDDARRELALNALRLNRPGEAIELLGELDPERGLMKHSGMYWRAFGVAHHMVGDYEGELEAARKDAPRARMYFVARALAALGRLDDVAAIVETRRSLPPSRETLSLWFGGVAAEARRHGHRDAAQEVLSEEIAWHRSRPLDTEESRAGLAQLLYSAARWDEAMRLYEELAEEDPENTEYLAALGRLAARRGDRDQALRISEELRASRYPGPLLQRARIAALLGDPEQAMTLLQQSFDLGAGWGRWPLLHSDIDFESLHDYPPFQELLRPKG
jgi:tetratricopeptide (TPR) repeat protein/TolB-like protein